MKLTLHHTEGFFASISNPLVWFLWLISRGNDYIYTLISDLLYSMTDAVNVG